MIIFALLRQKQHTCCVQCLYDVPLKEQTLALKDNPFRFHTLVVEPQVTFQFLRYFKQALQDRKWEEKVLPPAVPLPQVGPELRM